MQIQILLFHIFFSLQRSSCLRFFIFPISLFISSPITQDNCESSKKTKSILFRSFLKNRFFGNAWFLDPEFKPPRSRDIGRQDSPTTTTPIFSYPHKHLTASSSPQLNCLTSLRQAFTKTQKKWACHPSSVRGNETTTHQRQQKSPIFPLHQHPQSPSRMSPPPLKLRIIHPLPSRHQ